jgi:hypothetical protein
MKLLLDSLVWPSGSAALQARQITRPVRLLTLGLAAEWDGE